MVESDFNLDRAILCRSVGKAVSEFVNKTGERHFTLSVVCDCPDVTCDEDGVLHHGVNIRVYLDLNEDEDEEDD